MRELRPWGCPYCEGECEWEVHDGGYDSRDGSPTGYIMRCEHCHGTGKGDVEVEPITLDDMEEAYG